MKMPTLFDGVQRKFRRNPLSLSGGVTPQECEDLCDETFEPGTEEYAECLADCED
ncbi:MAG: hypothetical protein KC643_32105 [Nitrospira sp.]|nr:hypothetical protein [Nitrospira sp.]